MFKFLVKCKNSKSGFTLIELLTVVSVLGILTAIAIPVYTSVTKNMDKKFCQMNQQTLIQYVSRYMLGSYDGQKRIAACNLLGISDYTDNETFVSKTKQYAATENRIEVSELTEEQYNKYLDKLYEKAAKSTRQGNKWTCGSYDPDTNKWDGPTGSYIYLYVDDNAWHSYTCSTEGEAFVRYAYNIKPGEDAKLPSMRDGCQVYLTVASSVVTAHCTDEFHERSEPYSCLHVFNS